ncbi:MAG: patatin [Marinilabiliales bacterium]|nr:MAG: patatin [Marinilabiliales bacterium]
MKLSDYFNSLFSRKPDTFSLVLSGGGARGAIHLGVLQALDENDIKIEAVSGTSIGAVVGSLYCAGVKPNEIKDIMKSSRFAGVFQLSLNKGLLKMTKLKKALAEFIPVNEFKSLQIPFYCCVSNIDSGTYKIISSGDLSKAVLASASIPIIFAPVEINNNHYVDGGLFNNLPVDPFIGKKNILGVHVNNQKFTGANNMRSVAERVFSLISKQSVDKNRKHCKFFIEPLLEKNYNVLDFGSTQELFDIGYREGISFVKQLK